MGKFFYTLALKRNDYMFIDDFAVKLEWIEMFAIHFSKVFENRA